MIAALIVAEGLAERLGDLLRSHSYEIAPFLTAVFLSRGFYSAASIGTHIKSPIELIVSTSRKLGLAPARTMQVAQRLYEGIDIGSGTVGLITYMRTDSTNLSPEALEQIRGFVQKSYGAAYLPDKPNIFSSSNKDAQEAHEAIRPTDVARRPEDLREALTEEQFKLYNLIWQRTVACQMTPAQWDATSVMFERDDEKTGAVLRASGRILVFDGFLPRKGGERSVRRSRSRA